MSEYTAVPGGSSASCAASSAASGGPARTQDGGQAAGFWGADGTGCVPAVIYGHDWQGPRA